MGEENLLSKVKALPDKPGIYIFSDICGSPLYIGKAISLRKRVRSYFHSSSAHHIRTDIMISQATDLEYIETDSETEALILEYNLIKGKKPKYNVRLKDDKSYPYIKVTLKEKYPRVFLTRDQIRDGSRYFGPYTDIKAAKDTLTFLRKVFPLRTCKNDNLQNSRPCLNYHIKKCLAPCDNRIKPGDYLEMVEEICLFLEGRTDAVIKKLKSTMDEMVSNLNFEGAAIIRDRIDNIEKVVERQKIISTNDNDQDIIGMVIDEKRVCVQVFCVREGKLKGRDHFFFELDYGNTRHPLGKSLTDIKDYEDKGEILSAFLQGYYMTTTFIPKYILLGDEINDIEFYENWFKEKKGEKVYIQYPKRGEKKRFIDMAERNALLVLEEEKLKAEREYNFPREALLELKEVLGLKDLPYRIEGFDISNIQGAGAVGSLVVFEGGKPLNSAYRKFRIKSVKGQDDFGMMKEMLARRAKYFLVNDSEDDETGNKDKKTPGLILVDGGKGQLSAALEVIRGIGLTDVPVIGLAKKREEIFMEGRKDPLILPPTSKGLHLLQRIRDEAHRFAIRYHRDLRKKTAITSELDSIPGIGKNRRTALLKRFGSVKGVKEATVDEISEVTGISNALAIEISKRLSNSKG